MYIYYKTGNKKFIDPCNCQEVKAAIFKHVNNSNMVLTMGSQQNYFEQCTVSVTPPFEHSCEIKYSCYMQRKYIRSDYTGIVTDNLFSDITCDLHNSAIDHKLCVQWGVSNVTKCYERPCKNDGANLSTCSSRLQYYTHKVNGTGVENGTLISVFCMRGDCREFPTHMTIFNTIIGKVVLDTIMMKGSTYDTLAVFKTTVSILHSKYHREL